METNVITEVIEKLEAERNRIDNAIQALRGVQGGAKTVPVAKTKVRRSKKIYKPRGARTSAGTAKTTYGIGKGALMKVMVGKPASTVEEILKRLAAADKGKSYTVGAVEAALKKYKHNGFTETDKGVWSAEETEE